MTRIIIIVLIIVAALGIYRWLRAKQHTFSRAKYARIAVLLLLAICVVLALSGRAHWLAVFVAGALALLQRALPVMLRYFPLAQQYYKRSKGNTGNQSQSQHQSQGQSQQQYSARTASHMSTKEALGVLGLKAGASKEEIIQAHRKLIQKLHPDRGGSDHLAAQVNEAKRVLLAS